MKNVICLSLIVFFCLTNLGYGSIKYSTSAHGNPDYGVFRSEISTRYVQGNCGHCHEQHASIDSDSTCAKAKADPSLLIGVALKNNARFNPYESQDNVCFLCHSATASLQYNGIENDYYSVTFGAASPTSTGILQAFNQASYHNLYDIKKYITGQTGAILQFPPYKLTANPCAACHNIHIAKANKRYPSDPTYAAISKPSEHEQLWGDDSPRERMNATVYQQPYDVNNNYEPDGGGSSRTIQALKTPDYNTFCTECHNSTSQIPSTTLNRDLYCFDWNTDKHGAGGAGNVVLKSPYSWYNSYTLSCTDCHEPHGSSNAFLIRNYVNGIADKNNDPNYPAGPVVLPPGDKDTRQLCCRCHSTSLRPQHHYVRSDLDEYYNRRFTCRSCHINDRPPDSALVDCTNCHYHGHTYEAWYPPANGMAAYSVTRRLF